MIAGDKIVFFDGICNLCTKAVQFIIKRDPKGKFRFASLQSDYAQKALKELGFSTAPQFIVYLSGNRVYTQSTALLMILWDLKGVWRLLFILILIPRPLRDWIYNWIARNRYRIWGKRETCMVPTPELKSRFLE